MHISDWGSDVCSSDLLPFRALTSALDGFGVFATGNYTYSSIKFANNPIEAITLPGLSQWTGSGTVYFEKCGFEARANYRYSSSCGSEERREVKACVMTCTHRGWLDTKKKKRNAKKTKR